MRFIIFLIGTINMFSTCIYFTKHVVNGDFHNSRINLDDAFDDEEEDFGFIDSDDDGDSRRGRSDSVISV